jgi:hypothetical protein
VKQPASPLPSGPAARLPSAFPARARAARGGRPVARRLIRVWQERRGPPAAPPRASRRRRGPAALGAPGGVAVPRAGVGAGAEPWRVCVVPFWNRGAEPGETMWPAAERACFKSYNTPPCLSCIILTGKLARANSAARDLINYILKMLC